MLINVVSLQIKKKVVLEKYGGIFENPAIHPTNNNPESGG
jgi:hypothetical protein